MNSNSGSASHSAKRQKVAVACDSCRTKKIRCDGNRPICEPCSRRKKNPGVCTWNESESRGSYLSRQQVERRQRHTGEEEGGDSNRRSRDTLDLSDVGSQPERGPQNPIQGLYGVQNSAPSSVLHPTERARNGLFDRTNQPLQASSSFTRSAPTPDSPSVRRQVSGEDERPSILASGMLGSLPEPGQPREYFGSSSAGCFINQVRRKVRQRVQHTDQPILDQQNPTQAEQVRPVVQRPQSFTTDIILPARSKADQLMQIYWDVVHILYPFVDKEETMYKYQCLWTGQTECENDRIFVGTLNVILALSSQLNEAVEAQNREELAKMYFQRAKEFLDIWALGTFEAVQVYLLLGQYFQSTNEPRQCWMVIGAAIRTAQSLGLHLPETTERIPSPRKRELTRKVWHGCILMDRVVSMAYGRPPMISVSTAMAVPRPIAINEEQSREITPPQGPSLLDFFIQSLVLYDILYDVLVGFYSSSSLGSITVNEAWKTYLGRSGTDNKPSALDIERRLVQWEINLPAHLRIIGLDEQTESNRHFIRQAIVLRQRYLHVRLLSLRPVLSAYLTSETSNEDVSISFGGDLSRRIALNCAVTCVTIAQETIDLAYSKSPSHLNSVGQLAAWWYNVLFIYSAATVLVAAKLCPSILSEIPKGSLSRSWDLAIELLQRYQCFSSVIQQLVAALRLLFDVLPAHYLQSQEAAGLATQTGQPLAPAGPNSGTLIPSSSEIEQAGLTDEEPFRMNNCASLADRELENSALDFLFDSYDLSWLNTAPFDQ